jgi:hypothetical protein
VVRITTPEEAFALLAALPRSAGLPDAEIDRWEAACRVRFIADFRRLLRVAGGSLGCLFPSGLEHPSQIGELRREASELFADGGWEPGPTDVVVEIFEQGSGAVFLRPSGCESRVFRYLEGAAGPEDTGLPLGLYLATALERHLCAVAEPQNAPDTGREIS